MRLRDKLTYTVDIIEYKGSDNLFKMVFKAPNGYTEGPGNFPAEVDFHPSGNVKLMAWKDRGKPHRDDDKPAILTFVDRPGLLIESASWYQHGEMHRAGMLPCWIHIDTENDRVNGLMFLRHGVSREDEGLPSYVWIEPDGTTVDEGGHPIECDLSRFGDHLPRPPAVELPPFLALS